MLEIQLTGKTTEKRQNPNSSTPPARAEHPHSMVNRETGRGALSTEEEGRGNPSQ
jgi:hypothetical protein